MKYVLALVMCLLLIGCSADNQDTKAKQIAEQLKNQAETVEEVEEGAQPPAEETQPGEQEVAEEEPEMEPPVIPEVTEPDVIVRDEEVRPTLYNYLDTYTQRVDGYSFVYHKNKYYVKDKKVKVILSEPKYIREVTIGDQERRLFYYDTVYLDTVTRTAKAYCEGHERDANRECTALELFDLEYPVSYDDYIVIMPVDWLFSYLETEPDNLEENKFYVKGRLATLVEFEEDEYTVELNFDKLTGLVLRADKKLGRQLIERHDYEDLVVNKVRDVDVKHRSKDEIPSSEVFYRR